VTSPQKVLVVEDKVADLDIYAEVIEANGFKVDKATCLVDAKAMVDRTTYAAMIVDISLGGPQSDDTDGLTLLSYANNLDEGTAIIMLTGHPDTQIASAAVPVMGAANYFSKTHIAKVGIQPLIDAIKSAVSSNRLNLYRGAGDIVESICGKAIVDIWVDKCLRSLRPKGGFAGLREFLDGLLNPALPLLPPRETPADQRLALDEAKRVMNGIFWGKGYGNGVEVTVVSEGNSDGLGVLKQDAAREYRRAGLLGVVVARADLERADFA